MVKPGGTGRPRLAISARFAPLPPSRFFICALPSALPSPNVKTHFPLCDAGLDAGLDPDFAPALMRVRLAVLEARRADLDGRKRREWVFLAMVIPPRK